MFAHITPLSAPTAREKSKSNKKNEFPFVSKATETAKNIAQYIIPNSAPLIIPLFFKSYKRNAVPETMLAILHKSIIKLRVFTFVSTFLTNKAETAIIMTVIAMPTPNAFSHENKKLLFFI